MSTVDLVEAPKEVFGSLVDIIAAFVFWKVVFKGLAGQFCLENFDVVQKEYDRCAPEPFGVNEAVEEEELFHHRVLASFFQQDLVIASQINYKYDRRRIRKNMDPFLPLRHLATNINVV
jgi:hypothetical protein